MDADFVIRPITEADVEAVAQLSLLAWEPVFVSFRHILGDEIFLRIYPDWQTQQRAAVEKICRSEHATVLVPEVDGVVAGFIAYTMNTAEKKGEVEYLAVHPAYQNRGIGTALNLYVLDALKAAGIELVEVGTGGDPGHAPARRSYEKAGYIPLPIVRYYQHLTD